MAAVIDARLKELENCSLAGDVDHRVLPESLPLRVDNTVPAPGIFRPVANERRDRKSNWRNLA